MKEKTQKQSNVVGRPRFVNGKLITPAPTFEEKTELNNIKSKVKDYNSSVRKLREDKKVINTMKQLLPLDSRTSELLSTKQEEEELLKQRHDIIKDIKSHMKRKSAYHCPECKTVKFSKYRNKSRGGCFNKEAYCPHCDTWFPMC